jgi:hypothetical protein
MTVELDSVQMNVSKKIIANKFGSVCVDGTILLQNELWKCNKCKYENEILKDIDENWMN